MAVGGRGYASLEGLEISLLFWFRMTSCDKAGSSVSQILRDLDLCNQIKERFSFSIQMLQFFINELVQGVAPFLTALIMLLFS